MDKETLLMILIIILLIVSAIAKSQQDAIAFGTTKIKWKWWLNRDYKFNFWLKIPFSFLEGGWHLCDAVRTFSLMLALALLIGTWWLSIIFYIVYGIIFEVSYKYL